MEFRHQRLIRENEINVSQLPKDLQASIKQFDLRLHQYETAEEHDDVKEVKELKATLKTLSDHIAEEIIEAIDTDELGDDEEVESLPKSKEGILKYLFDKGIKKVTKEELKNYGYPTGFFSSLTIKGETIGNYSLFRNNANEKHYQIHKLR